MKKILGIAAILTIAMFASGVLAQNTVPEQVTVSAPTCGASTGGASFDFDTMARGATSADQTVTVTTSGDSPADIWLYGTDWCDSGVYDGNGNCVGGDTMVVGQTHWYTAAGGPYTSMTPLKLSASHDDLGLISSGSSFTHYFELQIPAVVAAGTFYQTITYTANC